MEFMIIRNCAPVLGGIKTGSLFNCTMENGQLRAKIEALNKLLSKKGIVIYILKTTPNYSLIYVCRKKMLVHDMENPRVKVFLKTLGYSDFEFDRLIETLKMRLNTCSHFPHEIGLFLGYPLDDVIGFIKNKGSNFKLCGYWKVYDDETKALKLFRCYSRCTKIYIRAFRFGRNLEELTL